MIMTESRVKKVKDIAKKNGPIIRASSLRAAKFCSKDIECLVQDGILSRIRRGFYAFPSVLDNMAEQELLSLLVPKGVLCLFSAAQFHDMTTVNPQSIDIAVPANMRIPILPPNIPVTIYRPIQSIYKIGITKIPQKGYSLMVYDRERTVCDFFRLRLQIGKDVTLEVLKNYLSGRKNFQKLYEYADALQIRNVIHPYLEAMN
jgi:predicted transcriptional regulator of viral defense system